MKLYINDKEVYLEKELDVNMSWKFVDTYNPSAIKTSYSKTISIPDCAQNAEIFGSFKVKYNFDLFSSDGRIVEKGYCTLDNITTVGTQKTYNITLYGGLGDFFYNLKGDEDNPKTLASLYWGDITNLTPEEENEQPLMTWDNQYVYSTWFNPENNKVRDTFRAVPCIYNDGIVDRSHTIIPNNGELFTQSIVETQDEVEHRWEGFVGRDGTQGLLVETEELDCYGKQDFKSDLMPLGIKYRSIIEACCKPENNGGYTVTLDGDFFNANNPYWNNMFLLKTLPSLDYDFTTTTSSYDSFNSNLVRVGNYLGNGASSNSTVLVPSEAKDPWIVDGNTLKVDPQFELVDNRIKYSVAPFIHIPADQIPSGDISDYNHGYYVKSNSNLQLLLKAVNVDTGETILLDSRVYDTNEVWGPLSNYQTFTAHYVSPGRYRTVPDIFPKEPLEGIVSLSSDWTHIRLQVDITSASPNLGFTLYYRQELPFIGRVNRTKTIKGDMAVLSNKNFTSQLLIANRDAWNRLYPYYPWDLYLEDSKVSVEALYTKDLNIFEPLEFTKKDLLQGTSSPFDYLVWFTKMFNLRLYMEPGTKKVSILTANNFVRQLEPLDIHDKICYDKDYSKTRKIIDEGYLKFNLTPNKNSTTEAYRESVDENLFDGYFAVTATEGKGQKEYLGSNLKIGSKARIRNILNRRSGENNSYYGFNQGSPFEVTYVSGSSFEPDFRREDMSLNYLAGVNLYDFLTLDEDINNTIVMYSGLKDTPFSSSHGPAVISRTSVDMVRLNNKPCWISGVSEGAQGSSGRLLGVDYIVTYQIPHYGLVPNVNNNYSYGLSYSNLDYESLIVTSNIYNLYLKDFIENLYVDPLVVECWVRLSSPELRRLYWFNNEYWVLTEISNYNYRDEPVKCKFIRYRYA